MARTRWLLLSFLIFGSLVTAQLPVRRTILSPDDSSAFAIAAAALGDLDGDGVCDFAVSETTSTPFTPIDEVHLFSGRTGMLLRSHLGVVNSDDFGRALVGTGDLNGDGVPDLAVGAPEDATNGAGSGRVDVLSGLDGALLRQVFGVDGLDACGEVLAAIDDVDGDGTRDLIVGSTGEDPAGPGAGGVARVHSGATGAVLRYWVGGDPSEGFADGLAGCPDLNGDSVPDVLIGVPGRYDSGLQMRVGAVEVRSGLDGTLIRELRHVTGVNFNHGFGHAVAAIPDLDGDGVPELLFGAPGDDTNGSNTGALYVHSGADGSLIIKHVGQAQGPTALGLHVTGVGDVNGDGYSDYAGAADSTGTVGYSGYVRIYSGLDHSVLAEIQSPGPVFDGFGSCLVALPDVSGDRLPEILIGAKQARRAHVMSVAGSRSYGENLDPTQTLDLSWIPETGPDTAQGRIVLSGAPTFAIAGIVVSLNPHMEVIAGASILVDWADPSTVYLDVPIDGAGGFDSGPTTVRQTDLDGISLFLQVAALDALSPIGFVTSAGLELRCTN